jgi:hypothetical protein
MLCFVALSVASWGLYCFVMMSMTWRDIVEVEMRQWSQVATISA